MKNDTYDIYPLYYNASNF